MNGFPKSERLEPPPTDWRPFLIGSLLAIPASALWIVLGKQPWFLIAMPLALTVVFLWLALFRKPKKVRTDEPKPPSEVVLELRKLSDQGRAAEEKRRTELRSELNAVAGNILGQVREFAKKSGRHHCVVQVPAKYREFYRDIMEDLRSKGLAVSLYDVGERTLYVSWREGEEA